MVASGNGEENDAGGEEDAPLDPAVERVRARLRRLMLVSGLTTLLGFSAVTVAIFYRLSAPTDSPAVTAGAADEAASPAALPARLSVTVPAGARIEAVSASGPEIVLVVRPADGDAFVLVVDRRTGQVVQRVGLDPVPQASPGLPGG